MPNYSVQFPDQESILHSFMRKSPVRDTDAYPHVAGPDTMVNVGNWRLWDSAGLRMLTATRRQKLCTLQASLVNRVHTVAMEKVDSAFGTVEYGHSNSFQTAC